MRVILAAAIFLAAFGVRADVSGTYNCTIRLKQTVSANGKSRKVSSVGSGRVTYFPDGTYESTTPISPFVSSGTWSQSGDKIYMSPNIDDAARDFLYGCTMTGANCLLVGVTASSTGKVLKNGSRIDGTSNIAATAVVNGVFANTTAVGKTTCTK